MRVLFAVSNDNITKSVMDKYQQKYKEIITNKNVYYFNAIINELQKNKFYDAIVIGEDLEPISNNNYDEIDKFLFEKLDSISDEASKPTGEDIPIIFICSDRRTKSNQLLIKLFGIGIYNAIIGNDRSIDTVCNLINKPRNKKEAKLYYKIDAEDVGAYERGDDQDVSETEIQNILAHYRKIGTNEKKCVESFDRIAEQYNDTQLRLIINFLPKDIKDILEVNSERYKKLMSNGTVLSNGTYTTYNKQNPKEPGKIDILTKDLEKTNLSNPVIIPSTINVNKNMNTGNIQNRQPAMNQNFIQPRPTEAIKNIDPNRQMQPYMQGNLQAQQPIATTNPQINIEQGMSINQSNNSRPIMPVNQSINPQQNTLANQQVNMQQTQLNPEINKQQNINQLQGVDKGMQTLINDNDNNINNNLENVASNVEQKRGRGRPRKVQVVPTGANSVNNLDGQRIEANVSGEPVVKRKRGRPSKKVEASNQGEFLDNSMQNAQTLPNRTDQTTPFNPVSATPNPAPIQSFDDVLPGLEETTEPVDLFGISPIEENTSTSSNDFLPGFEDNIENINSNTKSSSSDTNLFDLDLEENTVSQNSNTNNDINNLYDMQSENINDNNDLYNLQSNDANNNNDLYNNDLYNMQNADANIYNNDLYNTQNVNQNAFENPYNNIYDNDNLFGNNQVNSTINNNQMQQSQFSSEVNSNQNQQNQFNSGFNNNQMQNADQMPYTQNNMQYNQNNILNDNNLMNMQNTNPVNNNVIAGNGKIAIFVGTSKNGTSFIVNNLAQLLSQNGVKTAILDLTRNKNSYYMFTDNDANLMRTATDSIKNLSNGIVAGLNVNKNLTVFTSLPDGIEESNQDVIIQTLSNNFDITLLDCDFSTDIEYFVKANEIYLIQSMDTFTIQPLTQFLSDLKLKNVLDESKLRVIINKYVRLRKLDEKMIIGGMSKYNEPSMTLQRDLFNAQTIKSVTIPFEMETYAKYLESIAMCNLNLNGYSQNFISSLETLKNMVYPLISGGNHNNNSQVKTEEKRGLFGNKKNKNTAVQGPQFSSNVNDTLNKMRTNNF